MDLNIFDVFKSIEVIILIDAQIVPCLARGSLSSCLLFLGKPSKSLIVSFISALIKYWGLSCIFLPQTENHSYLQGILIPCSRKQYSWQNTLPYFLSLSLYVAMPVCVYIYTYTTIWKLQNLGTLLSILAHTF